MFLRSCPLRPRTVFSERDCPVASLNSILQLSDFHFRSQQVFFFFFSFSLSLYFCFVLLSFPSLRPRVEARTFRVQPQSTTTTTWKRGLVVAARLMWMSVSLLLSWRSLLLPSLHEWPDLSVGVGCFPLPSFSVSVSLSLKADFFFFF